MGIGRVIHLVAAMEFMHGHRTGTATILAAVNDKTVTTVFVRGVIVLQRVVIALSIIAARKSVVCLERIANKTRTSASKPT